MPFDIEKAVEKLRSNAQPAPVGRCAMYVRQALEAGGMDLNNRPLSAKDYGPYLEGGGFKSVSLTDYVATKGDVVVLQYYPGGDVHGHIAMFDGAIWISDFKQRDMWGGPGYRNNAPTYKVYRP